MISVTGMHPAMQRRQLEVKDVSTVHSDPFTNETVREEEKVKRPRSPGSYFR